MTPDLPAAATENYESAMGVIAVLQGKYDAALPHLKRADPEDPYAMFYQAEAMRLKGDAAGAAKMYKKVAASNQNGLGFALVRARATEGVGDVIFDTGTKLLMDGRLKGRPSFFVCFVMCSLSGVSS